MVYRSFLVIGTQKSGRNRRQISFDLVKAMKEGNGCFNLPKRIFFIMDTQFEQPPRKRSKRKSPVDVSIIQTDQKNITKCSKK